MRKHYAADGIMGSVLGVKPSPLRKVRCEAGDHWVPAGEFNEGEQLCETCCLELCEQSSRREQEMSECLVSMGN